ncbi:uncharacterized protein BJ171DRAFT_577986 [Polychytrium aggregatum]|uniref:uncharacterized protein n=1 Tax=Polychytrium aggregatum TaxID=110093 RepID=UPI0022FE24CA|nr:uncharacterized protein BJ171DRAFT_577986 [Polychytrium aggregatum]KAI9208170.1 hypothetical protein BJ171DRAFT_577986 [Polychytrium aggregatum]
MSPHGSDQLAEDSRVVLNVGGKTFETTRTTLQSLPTTLLGRLFSAAPSSSVGSQRRSRVSHRQSHSLSEASSASTMTCSSTGSISDSKGQHFFDRNPTIFAAVLEFYRTADLPIQIPLGVSVRAVEKELDYFGMWDAIEQIHRETGEPIFDNSLNDYYFDRSASAAASRSPYYGDSQRDSDSISNLSIRSSRRGSQPGAPEAAAAAAAAATHNPASTNSTHIPLMRLGQRAAGIASKALTAGLTTFSVVVRPDGRCESIPQVLHDSFWQDFSSAMVTYESPLEFVSCLNELVASMDLVQVTTVRYNSATNFHRLGPVLLPGGLSLTATEVFDEREQSLKLRVPRRNKNKKSLRLSMSGGPGLEDAMASQAADDPDDELRRYSTLSTLSHFHPDAFHSTAQSQVTLQRSQSLNLTLNRPSLSKVTQRFWERNPGSGPSSTWSAAAAASSSSSSSSSAMPPPASAFPDMGASVARLATSSDAAAATLNPETATTDADGGTPHAVSKSWGMGTIRFFRGWKIVFQLPVAILIDNDDCISVELGN